MNFLIAYEDAKILLQLFYDNPYKVSAPFVAILDNMKAVDADMNLKQAIEAEMALSQAKAEEGKSGQQEEPQAVMAEPQIEG